MGGMQHANGAGYGMGSLFNTLKSQYASVPGLSPNFQAAQDATPQVYAPQYDGNSPNSQMAQNSASHIYTPQYASGGQTTSHDGQISHLSAPSPWGTNQDTDANTATLMPHEAAEYRQKRLESLVGYANRAKGPNGQMPFNQMTAVQQAQMAAQGAAQAQPENVQNAAGGGIMGAESSLGGYATGGAPRLLKGPGDGMSDNIPAVIANKQPARLADGEFVIPADVVSHLGNGSTGAGAKHLHTMMDKVRKARTGNPKQGKQINPNKFMPR
jgi:hypothetical protein